MPPSPSPIRRIIDGTFALTGALTVNGWGLLLMLSVAAQSQENWVATQCPPV